MRIEKTGTLLFCSVLLFDKIRTASEQCKAEIGRKLKTILAELILPGSYKKVLTMTNKIFLTNLATAKW